jgi:YVTN family beta-propeller protein
VTPIATASNTASAPIPVGSLPTGIAITPNGTTAYVTNEASSTVTPIATASNTAGTPITVGLNPFGIAITPDGTTAYVVNRGSNNVTPIATASNTAGPPITVGSFPWAIAITPDGTTAYVTNGASSSVTPIATASNTAGTPITVGAGPFGIAITPDQAPVAHLSVTAGQAGSASSFDASASTVAFGSIATYAWTFGDGSTASTTAPTTTHTYAAAGTFTVRVTETSSGGTSTTQVFTGQTMSRNGGPSATASQAVTVRRRVPVPDAGATLLNAAGAGMLSLGLVMLLIGLGRRRSH